jgi:hypothetical protein
MNWGKWIIVAFLLFAGFIATLVTVCMRQDVNLVSKDYYKDELAYQDQISRINNANELNEKPVIKSSGNFLEVDFNQFGQLEKGELKLFRPSDSKMDKVFVIQPTAASKQIFALDGLGKGMYRARMKWQMNGKEYFVETIVTI